MPNYGQNPTTPDPKNEVSAIPPQPMQNPMQNPAAKPKSIREYLQMLGQNRQMREQMGQVPRFSNQPNTPMESAGPTHQIMDQPQGAIGPGKSRYESIPYDQRGQIDPYERVKQRLPDILPEIWESTFPGRPQGDMLSDKEMQQWKKSVMNVSNALLEKYDREHGEFRKTKAGTDKEAGKSSDKWQEKYWDLKAKGQLETNEEGMPVSEEEWVRQRIQTGSSLKEGDTSPISKGTPQRSQMEAGRKITGGDIATIMQEPQHRELADKIKSSYTRNKQSMPDAEAKRAALIEHQQEIMGAVSQ